MEKREIDVLIIGAGIAGLLLANKLSKLGVKILLIEKSNQLANGASIRNEGWLHNGTYHSTSIKNFDQAKLVAGRCIYGFNQITNYAPECVETNNCSSYALIRSKKMEMKAVERWTKFGVEFQKVNPNELNIKDKINVKNVHSAFLVRDKGINTRILYKKLLTEFIQYGGTLINPILSMKFSGGNFVFKSKKGEIKVHARITIYTTGYSTKNIFLNIHKKRLGLRFWKSHLLLLPRCIMDNYFFLESNELAIMNHINGTIIGMNDDASIVEEPINEVDIVAVKKIKEKLSKLLNLPAHIYRDAIPVSCIKTDFANSTNMERSLNINIIEPIQGHIIALPGKMTETPFLVDTLICVLYKRLKDTSITPRPLDVAGFNGLNFGMIK